MDDEKSLPPSHELIDQSRRVAKRAKSQIARAKDRIQRTEHRWMQVTLGRICEVCRLTQPDGEFDDESHCSGSHVS